MLVCGEPVANTGALFACGLCDSSSCCATLCLAASFGLLKAPARSRWMLLARELRPVVYQHPGTVPATSMRSTASHGSSLSMLAQVLRGSEIWGSTVQHQVSRQICPGADLLVTSDPCRHRLLPQAQSRPGGATRGRPVWAASSHQTFLQRRLAARRPRQERSCPHHAALCVNAALQSRDATMWR